MKTPQYLSHWVIGIVAVLVWFWGEKVGIPPDAMPMAKMVVTGLMGHALGTLTPISPNPLPTVAIVTEPQTTEKTS